MIEFCRPVLRCQWLASVYEPCSITLLPNHLFVEDRRRKLLSVHFDNVLFMEIQPHELHQNEHSLLIYLKKHFSASITQLLPQDATSDEYLLSIDDLITRDVLSRVVWSWYHYQMAKSAGIAFKFETSDLVTKTSIQTYVQALQSLRETPLHDTQRLSRVFSAFSKKVMSNVILKEICFQRCEIFIVCTEMLQHLLYSSTKNPKKTNLSKALWAEDIFDDPLLATVYERMKLFHQILSALVAIFHGSSILSERDYAISEMSGPFHVSSWLDVLAVDVYERISESVGHSVSREYETIIDEVDRSISMASRGLNPPSPDGFKSSLTWNMSQSVVNSNAFRELREADDTYTSRVLTPLKSRADHSSLEFSQALTSSSINDHQLSGPFSTLSASISKGN